MAAVSRLPATVPLKEGAHSFNAHDRKDMICLANVVRSYRDDPRNYVICGSLADMRVMIVSPWWLRLACWIGSQRSGAKEYAIWMAMFAKYPEHATALIDATADHIVNGQDREDPKSAGGFSQREVNFLVGVLKVMEEL